MIPLPPLLIEESPSASSFGKKCDNIKLRKRAERAQQVTSPPSRIGGSVTFSKRVRVKKVRSHGHYTKQEKIDTWYSPEEYDNIKMGCIRTLKLMSRNAGLVECEEYSSRGLEVRTRSAALTRKQNKAFALTAVLDEQENQQSEGVRHPERLGEAYRKIALVSQSVAQFMAKRHRETIEEYLNEKRQ
jgi:cobyrinic acid a,c-diamide synthase